MLQLGKVYMLGNELERNRVDICGLSEVRWKGQGHYTTTEGHTIVHSVGCNDDNGHFFSFLKMAGVEKVVTAYKKQCDEFLA